MQKHRDMIGGGQYNGNSLRKYDELLKTSRFSNHSSKPAFVRSVPTSFIYIQEAQFSESGVSPRKDTAASEKSTHCAFLASTEKVVRSRKDVMENL